MSSLSNAAAPNKPGPILRDCCRRHNLDPNAVLAEIRRRERNDEIRFRLAQGNRQTVGHRFADATLGELADELDAMLLPRQTERTIEMIKAFHDEREAQA